MIKGNHKLLVILLGSVLLRLVWITNNPPLYYDEAEYMLLARSLLKGNGYTLSYGTWQMSRPPLLSFILFSLFLILGETQTLAQLFCVSVSSLAVIATYYLAEHIYGRYIALFSALFTAINPVHVGLASAIISENLFALLEILLILAVLKMKDRKWAFAIPILFTLLFLTRYTAIYIGLFIISWLCIERRPQLSELLRSHYLYIGSAVAILILMPWFLIGQQYYGGPLGSVITYAAIQGTYRNIFELATFIVASIAVIPALPLFLLPFFIMGIYQNIDPWRNFLLLWIAISMILSAITEPLARFSPMIAVTYILRYNFISIPAFALATGRGLDNYLRNHGKRCMKGVLIIALFTLNLMASIYIPYYNRYVREQDAMVISYKEACAYLTSKMAVDEYALTNAPAFISYYSRRNCLLLPYSFSNLLMLMNQSHSSFIVVSFYEAQTDLPPPSYLMEVMNDERFALVFKLGTSEQPLVYVFRNKK